MPTIKALKRPSIWKEVVYHLLITVLLLLVIYDSFIFVVFIGKYFNNDIIVDIGELYIYLFNSIFLL